MLTDVLRVIVNKSFLKKIYEKKLIFWQYFLFLIKMVLKFS